MLCSVLSDSIDDCPNNCFGNGDCVSGTCHCFSGFRGPDCGRGETDPLSLHSAFSSAPPIPPHTQKHGLPFRLPLLLLLSLFSVSACGYPRKRGHIHLGDDRFCCCSMLNLRWPPISPDGLPGTVLCICLYCNVFRLPSLIQSCAWGPQTPHPSQSGAAACFSCCPS